ncbi:hypothetical protein K488DRAFT_83028 [Vararia minispora EC-137]|uniref:Uncharacterized protein n=1 Tax=Vararia minispora EC-137 TaxID=1314806 RepID=A0ACB8QVA2_9AGAM|nr:hypothetical protein K488DRAFT_83028 [Vararia minispora EC-137]
MDGLMRTHNPQRAGRPRQASALAESAGIWDYMTLLNDVQRPSSCHSVDTPIGFGLSLPVHFSDTTNQFAHLWCSSGHDLPAAGDYIPTPSDQNTLPRTDDFMGFPPAGLELQYDPFLPHPFVTGMSSLPACPPTGLPADRRSSPHALPQLPITHDVRDSQRPLHVHNLPPQAGDAVAQVRFRTNHACDPCRKRKAKCNGTIPCDRCESRHLDCIYSAERRMRGPNKPKHRPSPLALVDSHKRSRSRRRGSEARKARSGRLLQPPSSASSTSSFITEPPSSASSSISSFPLETPASATFGWPPAEPSGEASLPRMEACDHIAPLTPHGLLLHAQSLSEDSSNYAGGQFASRASPFKQEFGFDFPDRHSTSGLTDSLPASSASSSSQPSIPSSPSSDASSISAADSIPLSSTALRLDKATPNHRGHRRAVSDLSLLSSSLSVVTLSGRVRAGSTGE